MGRKRINGAAITVRMEAEALPQIREARLGKEKTADFIRTAIASELAKRKRQKQSAEWRKEIP